MTTPGRSSSWVRGHLPWDVDVSYRSERDPDGCTLPEGWLRLGVAPGAGVGWRLISERLPLHELLGVAVFMP